MNITNAPLGDDIASGGKASGSWQRWFSTVYQKLIAMSSQSDEVKTKVYSSSKEPTLSEDGSIAIWKDTTDPSGVVVWLVFKNGSSNVKVKLT